MSKVNRYSDSVCGNILGYNHVPSSGVFFCSKCKEKIDADDDRIISDKVSLEEALNNNEDFLKLKQAVSNTSNYLSDIPDNEKVNVNVEYRLQKTFPYCGEPHKKRPVEPMSIPIKEVKKNSKKGKFQMSSYISKKLKEKGVYGVEILNEEEIVSSFSSQLDGLKKKYSSIEDKL